MVRRSHFENMNTTNLTDQHGRKPLTERQHAVYKWIAEQCLDGLPPGTRDICREFNFKSTNAGKFYIEVLIAKGWVVRELNRANSVRPKVPELLVRENPSGGFEIATTGRVVLTAETLAGLASERSYESAYNGRPVSQEPSRQHGRH
jgi:SOS-response transcriptional repressor LexA